MNVSHLKIAKQLQAEIGGVNIPRSYQLGWNEQ